MNLFLTNLTPLTRKDGGITLQFDITLADPGPLNGFVLKDASLYKGNIKGPYKSIAPGRYFNLCEFPSAFKELVYEKLLTFKAQYPSADWRDSL